MTDYNIKLEKLGQQQGPVKRWWLDFPVADKAATLGELTDSGLLFQGWVLLDKPAVVQVYVKQAGVLTQFNLDTPRPDVVQIILKQDGANHPQRNCGFRFTLPMQAADFELGVMHNAVQYPLCHGHIAGPFKVLHGKDGWLFLDNDTNKSVEQYTGKLLLNELAKKSWAAFMRQMQQFSDRFSCKCALLIAPAKEVVYPQYYPFKKAEITPVEQLITLAPVNLTICYPLQALSEAKQRSFRLTDTHWTPYGAMLASVELAVALGLDREVIQKIFANDSYKEVKSIGDLGNKVFPPIKATELLLKSYSYRKYVLSDNGLVNFGRTIVLKNPQALVSAHLVIFGASSSYSMLDYLCRIFSHITLMHTAGNIDVSVLEQINPDYFVCQTNARYVVRAPVSDYKLAEVIATKVP